MNRNSMIVCVVFLVLLAGLSKLFVQNKVSSLSTTSSGNKCISETFKVGSSGGCVSDIQTMINFMETDSLNECKFTNGKTLSISGSFNESTKNQVSVVQNWSNCYNRQEDAKANVTVSGEVDQHTWQILCTYAYVYPSQASYSSSAYFHESTAAGKNAGCEN